MSLEDDTYCNFADDNEHSIFVNLLSKYEIILGNERAPNLNKIKCEAANALANEFNSKCERKLTARKVLKKVSNMKARLKRKNFKNLNRFKKLEYMDWEQKFLDLWVGNSVTALANNLGKPDDTSQSESITPDEIKVKIETDDYVLQDNSRLSTITPTLWETGSGAERRFEDDEGDYTKYESMTLDELKHIALISQIKTLKAQEAAAKAKKELSVYKLSLLKRNGIDGRLFF